MGLRRKDRNMLGRHGLIVGWNFVVSVTRRFSSRNIARRASLPVPDDENRVVMEE